MIAALFDLDGTLVDNMRFHAEAWVELTRRLGCERPRAFFEAGTAGKKGEEILRMLLGEVAGRVHGADGRGALGRVAACPSDRE